MRTHVRMRVYTPAHTPHNRHPYPYPYPYPSTQRASFTKWPPRGEGCMPCPLPCSHPSWTPWGWLPPPPLTARPPQPQLSAVQARSAQAAQHARLEGPQQRVVLRWPRATEGLQSSPLQKDSNAVLGWSGQAPVERSQAAVAATQACTDCVVARQGGSAWGRHRRGGQKGATEGRVGRLYIPSWR